MIGKVYQRKLPVSLKRHSQRKHRFCKLISVEKAEALLKMGSKPFVQVHDFETDLPRTPPDYFGIEVQPTELTEGLLSELTIMAASDGAISKGRAEEILSLR